MEDSDYESSANADLSEFPLFLSTEENDDEYFFMCFKQQRKSREKKMLLFCPTCANILVVEEGPQCYRFACSTCPYVHNVKQRITNRKYPKLKEVDDVLGGAAAWENVDSTEETCPKCNHGRAFFMQIQTRSADEPMTTFYKCCNPQCGHQWRD
ncbi:RNA polymerase III subunit K [Tachypleus tridentatus]|uniref:RNA polymerase III subunit K n=1 Tax=Tachypleus tridentatus TaxID=6853 RepID=UPI003FD2481F